MVIGVLCRVVGHRSNRGKVGVRQYDKVGDQDSNIFLKDDIIVC